MTTDGAEVVSLRERKKRATRTALSSAALRLAIERGFEHVLVEEIAAEAGVAPRTFNNYFPSKEAAIIAEGTERALRMREALRARPPDEPLWTAVRQAVAGLFASGADSEQGGADRELGEAGREHGRPDRELGEAGREHGRPDQEHGGPDQEPGEAGRGHRAPDREWVTKARLIKATPALRVEQLRSDAEVQRMLAEEIARRTGADERRDLYPRLAAASIMGAVRTALDHWLEADGTTLASVVDEALRQLADGLPAPTTRARSDGHG